MAAVVRLLGWMTFLVSAQLTLVIVGVPAALYIPVGLYLVSWHRRQLQTLEDADEQCVDQFAAAYRRLAASPPRPLVLCAPE